MAAKVILISEDGLKRTREKRSYVEGLVRRLEATALGKYLYKRLKIRRSDEITLDGAKLFIPDTLPKQYELPGIVFKLKSDPHASQKEASLARLANQLFG